MTLLIATVTPSAGWVSADTMVSAAPEPPEDLRVCQRTESADDALAVAFGASESSPPCEAVAFVSKIAIVPHLHLVMVGAGEWMPIRCWQQALLSEIPAAGIDDLTRLAPALLRQIRDAVGSRPFAVHHVGWSESRDAVVGVSFYSPHDFEPSSMAPGHLMQPPINPSDQDYSTLFDLWEPAAHGKDTERFHRLVAENVERSRAAGLYRYDSGIGGQLHTAKVDASGISVSQSYTFSETAVHGAREAAESVGPEPEQSVRTATAHVGGGGGGFGGGGVL